MTSAHTPLIDRERGLSLAGNDAQIYSTFLAAFPTDTTCAAMLCAQLGLLALGEASSAVCELMRGGDEGNLPAARARAQDVAALHEATCDAIRDSGAVSFR